MDSIKNASKNEEVEIIEPEFDEDHDVYDLSSDSSLDQSSTTYYSDEDDEFVMIDDDLINNSNETVPAKLDETVSATVASHNVQEQSVSNVYIHQNFTLLLDYLL
jgi:hypothetical protein